MTERKYEAKILSGKSFDVERVVEKYLTEGWIVKGYTYVSWDATQHVLLIRGSSVGERRNE